ncbi:Oidioi.mRNA.OKI2018_I69.PAR.g9664.t1.cds [Oikopleura dioica]|uniref:Oidioi.mRNA.OKI2018_I69.PAR.g9664.t1.cds n=1 Tax=Oikopleura dioica TaxID=34765 RepID=A0ABN7RSG6_OIKDI|nr:Oidioi.mRNA.OKI2018_I69.PAR.g9664.t1.cds [Oikopleura dioica]
MKNSFILLTLTVSGLWPEKVEKTGDHNIITINSFDHRFTSPSFARVIYRPENQEDNIYKASIGCNGFIGNRFRFWTIKDCLDTTYLPELKKKVLAGDIYIMYRGINQIEGPKSPNVKYQKVSRFYVRTYHLVFAVEEAFQFDEVAHPARFMNLQEYVRNVKKQKWPNCVFLGENEENRRRVRGGLEYKNVAEKLIVQRVWKRKSFDAWHDTFTISGDSALSNSDIGSPVLCKTYPNNNAKGSFKIIGMIVNHDVYDKEPMRAKGKRDFAEVKINLSFAEFFASNTTDSRKRVNRRPRPKRKKFDVENTPDKFWKLSKNNFILKEEVDGTKKKHPVHRAYLHPEFLRPKSKNKLYRFLPHIIFLLVGLAFYTGWKVFNLSVEKLSHWIMKGVGFLLWIFLLLAYLMKLDTDEDPGSQLYTLYGQFIQQRKTKEMENPFSDRASLHSKFLELQEKIGSYSKSTPKSKMLIRLVKLGSAALIVFVIVFKLDFFKEIVPFVVPVALLLVLCLVDHNKPLLKNESYKSVDIRSMHRNFIENELICIREHLLKDSTLEYSTMLSSSPSDSNLMEEIEALTELNEKKQAEIQAKLEAQESLNFANESFENETTAFLSPK